ncbi:hypothetical protein ACROYT_G015633 [Oculina patagonica]
MRKVTCGATASTGNQQQAAGSSAGPNPAAGSTATITRLPVGKRHNLEYHFYADDTQLYVAFKTDSLDRMAQCKTSIEQCVCDIDNWMAVNKLKLNQEKTEVVLISSRYLQIGNVNVVPTSSARNLGAIFDQCFNLEEHIKSICKSSHYHIRNLAKIRKYIDEESAKTVTRVLSLKELFKDFAAECSKNGKSLPIPSAVSLHSKMKYDLLKMGTKGLNWPKALREYQRILSEDPKEDEGEFPEDVCSNEDSASEAMATETGEEWIALCYGRDLRYIGCVVKESASSLTVRFLERRAGGVYEIKRHDEEVEKGLVFMHNITVKWVGPGRYQIPDEKSLSKKHVDHWNLLRKQEKVDSAWDNAGQIVDAYFKIIEEEGLRKGKRLMAFSSLLYV